MLPFKTLSDIPDVRGKRVLVRAELNAPQARGSVIDDSRLKAALPTIRTLAERGARVIVIAHASSLSKGERLSLEPVSRYLAPFVPITFIREYAHGEAYGAVSKLEPGSVILFENLRFDPREEAGDAEFAKSLASYGDIYVNDAFPVSHRAHASVTEIPKLLPSYAGFQFEKEYAHLSEALNPPRPFLFILGGAKFETKLPIAKAFLEKADTVFLGGALMNPLFKEKGLEIGRSLVPSEEIPEVQEMLNHPRLMLPKDVVSVQGGEALPLPVGSVGADGHILDIGPETVRALKEKISEAAFILWNGPLGDFERGFRASTDAIADAVRNSHAKSILGGGDSIASIAEAEGKDFTFISTAGGAMLDFLAHGTLPGIEALRQHE